MNKMNEFIEALRSGSGYDWICRNGHELNKYELIDIIKEYDYAIHDNTNPYEKKLIYGAAADELSSIYDGEEEEE